MTDQAKRDEMAKFVDFEEETDELRHQVLTDETQTDEEFAQGLARVRRRQTILVKRRGGMTMQPKAVSAPEPALTKQQAIVLPLHRQGRSPTEIGRQLGISSQAVHGHLTRLRAKGIVEPLAGRREPTPASPTPEAALEQVRRVIARETEQLTERDRALGREIERIELERREIAAALRALRATRASLSALRAAEVLRASDVIR